MKLFAKTSGWTVVSGIIFMTSAVASGCDWKGAAIATLITIISKTPAYAVYEKVFHCLWKSKKICPVCQAD